MRFLITVSISFRILSCNRDILAEIEDAHTNSEAINTVAELLQNWFVLRPKSVSVMEPKGKSVSAMRDSLPIFPKSLSLSRAY